MRGGVRGRGSNPSTYSIAVPTLQSEIHEPEFLICFYTDYKS
jgi:hypothetical protein